LKLSALNLILVLGKLRLGENYLAANQAGYGKKSKIMLTTLAGNKKHSTFAPALKTSTRSLNHPEKKKNKKFFKKVCRLKKFSTFAPRF
jgi:hypothetical protein